MNKILIAALVTFLTIGAFTSPFHAAEYVVDTRGAHASINFKVQHLGYSWVTGRFDKFEGKFSYDAKDIAASKIEINIDASSVNTNHAARNKHIKSDDFLDSSQFATAKFVSNSVSENPDGTLKINGTLSLHGITKDIIIDATKVGEGDDPWGGYRVGFTGTSSIKMKDFGIKMDLGPASAVVYFELNIEGIRK